MAKPKYLSRIDLESIVKLRLDNDEFPKRYMVSEITFKLNGGYSLTLTNGDDTLLDVNPKLVVVLEAAPQNQN